MKLLPILLLLSTSLYAFAGESIDDKEQESKYYSDVCDANLIFNNKPMKKKQVLDIDKKTTLTMYQFLSEQSFSGKNIATNVICQQLDGAIYTGGDEEWAGVIQNAISAIQASGAQDIQLVLTNNSLKVFPSLENNKEYDFKADFNGNKQLIKNFTYIDKPKNTVYTISVSGAQVIKSEVINEFTRIVTSFSLEE